MTSTARPHRMTIDLQDLKQPWLDYCKAHRITPSDALRQVVAKLTKVLPTPVEVQAPLGKIRKAITLTQDELDGAEAAARADGFAFNRWVIALIRARLGKGPQLGQSELEALARSNMQVMAIGRNINQMVRELRSNPAIVNADWLAEISAVKATIEDHAATVAGVLESNVRRWRVK